jgi:hypothetical protein
MSYNIRTYNNKITFFETGLGGNITATLDQGAYDITNLCSEIKKKLDATSLASGHTWTYTCLYNDNTLKITISAGGVNTFSFKFASGTNQAYKIMGFNNSDGVDATSQVSDNVIDCNYPKFYNIRINELQNRIQTTNSNEQNYTFTIFNDALAGYYSQFNIQSNYNIIEFSEHNKNIHNLTICLKDENDTIINLNKADWFMILQFEN